MLPRKNQPIDAPTAGDKAQSVATTSRKLAHMYRLMFLFPQTVEDSRLTGPHGELQVVPAPLARRFTECGGIPFWLEECPEQYESEWGSQWEKIREALQEMSDLETKTEVDSFKWKGSPLDAVAKLARKQKWDSCMDEEVSTAIC
jgi:hypothetical protein